MRFCIRTKAFHGNFVRSYFTSIYARFNDHAEPQRGILRRKKQIQTPGTFVPKEPSSNTAESGIRLSSEKLV